MTGKPFRIVFGWKPKDYATKKSTVVQFDPTEQLLSKMYELCKTVKWGYMHNAKFDMHMVKNFNMPYPHKNIREGGPSLALKKLADKYVEKNSSAEQKQIKSIKLKIQKILSTKLNTVLQEHNFDKKIINKIQMQKIAQDPINELSDFFPELAVKIYNA